MFEIDNVRAPAQATVAGARTDEGETARCFPICPASAKRLVRAGLIT